ncbi:MAG: hypothetical protein GAK28_04928 [Luteibacter sp.]|uniref:phage portal protein n=1 Tax=Luteibacter sp. TaxID=1886636 RepID=UPI00138098CC|nr:phage portal protein [Luteibacter sp.]KAF1003127.1 MAG: hypothetical protein GAK28_04928 [Luteibacter sp.]
MFDTLANLVPRDNDLPLRAWRLEVWSRVLDGSIYDVLPYQFHEERNGAGEYVPVRDRRPSVRTGLIRTVVDDSISLLFSEGHFPSVECKNEATKEALDAISKDAKLNLAMIDAATRGSVGSVAIAVRFLSSRVFLKVMATTYLTPFWSAEAPDTLDRVVERRKVDGKTLVAAGYDVKDDATQYWFEREWTTTAETWFAPRKVADKEAPRITDADRSTTHGLGFVPIVWVKNLPGGDDIDGEPTFGVEPINTTVEADYLLSQAGRGLKYSADPTLLIKETAATDDGQPMVRSAANAIVVGEKGDAKMLEINGTASEAVLEYVSRLREFALERMHGNRSNADKLSAAQSGRALELMHQALIWLADKLRASYGEGALLDIYRMIVRGSAKFSLTINGQDFGRLADNEPVTLSWPAWFPPTADDRQTLATALATLIKVGSLSRETAVRIIASDYDITDVQAEMLLIDAERKALLAELPAEQTKITSND